MKLLKEFKDAFFEGPAWIGASFMMVIWIVDLIWDVI